MVFLYSFPLPLPLLPPCRPHCRASCTPRPCLCQLQVHAIGWVPQLAIGRTQVNPYWLVVSQSPPPLLPLLSSPSSPPPGSRAKETVYLLNNESSPFHFNFVEQSCHCAGHSAQLHVSPMKGTIPSNGKSVLLAVLSSQQ